MVETLKIKMPLKDLETHCFDLLRDFLKEKDNELVQAHYFSNGIKAEVKSRIDGKIYQVEIKPK